jgi:hypothetical protein
MSKVKTGEDNISQDVSSIEAVYETWQAFVDHLIRIQSPFLPIGQG